MKTDGALLRFATEETRESNKEICLAAVSVTGTAIQHCGREFKADMEICKAAVGQDWRALRHVAAEARQAAPEVGRGDAHGGREGGRARLP